MPSCHLEVPENNVHHTYWWNRCYRARRFAGQSGDLLLLAALPNPKAHRGSGIFESVLHWRPHFWRIDVPSPWCRVCVTLLSSVIQLALPCGSRLAWQTIFVQVPGHHQNGHEGVVSEQNWLLLGRVERENDKWDMRADLYL